MDFNAKMPFEGALAALKTGERVARDGWNGRGMCLFFMPGYMDGVPANANTARGLGVAEGTIVVVRPYIVMRTVDGSIVPWLASQADLLAEDWRIAK